MAAPARGPRTDQNHLALSPLCQLPIQARLAPPSPPQCPLSESAPDSFLCLCYPINTHGNRRLVLYTPILQMRK